MRALRIALGLLLMVISIISAIPLVWFKVPNGIWYSAVGFALGCGIYWFARNEK